MSSDNPISDYSSVIGFLTHLTTEELKSILNDDAKLDELLKEIKQVWRVIFLLYFILCLFCKV